MMSIAVLRVAIYLKRPGPTQKERTNIIFYRNEGRNDRKKNVWTKVDQASLGRIAKAYRKTAVACHAH
jgi:hypothetical protein